MDAKELFESESEWDLWEELLEEEEEEEEEDEEDEDEDDDEEEEEERTFSQTEVNRIMSREKKSGRRSGQRKVLEELGVSSISEAKEKLAATKTGKKNKEEDEEDDSASNEELLKAQRERDEAKREAEQTKLEAKVERKLLAADADPKRVEKALRLIDLSEIEDDDDIEDAIEDLRDELPEFFLEDDDDDDEEDGVKRSKSRRRKSPPPSNPGGAPRKKRQPTASDRAAQRLKERHGSKLAKSE